MITINNADDALKIIQPMIEHPLQEELFVIHLNIHNDVICVKLMALGDESSVIFPKKHIARDAIQNISSAIILAHTHPSNNVAPSKMDIKQTDELKQTLKLFDTSILDHLIIGKDRYFSFNSGEEHKLQTLKFK